MKKIILTTLFFLFLFSLTACTQNQIPEPKKDLPPPESFEETVADIIAFVDSDQLRERIQLEKPFYVSSKAYSDVAVTIDASRENSIIITGHAAYLSQYGSDINKKVSEILQYCTNYSEFIDYITVIVAITDIDNYGVESSRLYRKCIFPMSELAKINWDNFSHTRIFRFSPLIVSEH